MTDPIDDVDPADVQGNVLRGYGRSFAFARMITYSVAEPAAGRAFLAELLPLVTTASPWTPTSKPAATTNVAITHHGLRALGLGEATLRSFPIEFATGMRSRASLLGDVGPSAPGRWDPVWSGAHAVDLLVWIMAQDRSALGERDALLTEVLAQATDGRPGSITRLGGHRAATGLEAHQDGEMIGSADGGHVIEHFGFRDGISDPVVAARGPGTRVIGAGKPRRGAPADDERAWEPLATGELLLGHEDEARQTEAGPIPSSLARNGTFMVVRKLHQNVATFRRYVADVGARYGDADLFAAKLVGRWPDGAPLATFGSSADASRRAGDSGVSLNGFDYRDDLDGAGCPVGSHVRRTNPRGALEFGGTSFETPGALVDRRRLFRRGIPYGAVADRDRDDGEHGLLFVCLGASIGRQFEFVQRAWINDGNGFRRGSDRDPIAGTQPPGGGRMTIEASDGRPPFFCDDLPTFVETRGGDYFFMPGIDALRSIAEGRVDAR